jgi:hypothetical protein
MRKNRFTRRAPRRNWGLSWGRFQTEDGSAVTYRLWRRDHSGALHVESRRFDTSELPAHIAKVLRSLKRQLRDRVDEIDLAAMGELYA